MNENANYTAKWLKYLLYAGLAALVNSLIGYIPLVGFLSRWLGIAISAAAIYLLFQLANTNARYRTAAIASVVALVCGLFSGTIPALIILVCGIIAEYQEYHGHGELVADRDPKLAGKWNWLFWLQLVMGLVVGVVVGLVGAVLLIVTGSESEMITSITSILSVGISLIMRVLYLVYLHRTVKLLEDEIVV